MHNTNPALVQKRRSEATISQNQQSNKGSHKKVKRSNIAPSESEYFPKTTMFRAANLSADHSRRAVPSSTQMAAANCHVFSAKPLGAVVTPFASQRGARTPVDLANDEGFNQSILRGQITLALGNCDLCKC